MYSLSELFYDAKGMLREPFYDYYGNYVYPNELDLLRDKRRNWIRYGELFRDGRDTLRRYDPDKGPMIHDTDL